MKRFITTMLGCLAFLLMANADPSQRKSLFDSDWRFMLGDVEGAEKVDFIDKSWRTLMLPHDWSIEQPITKDAPAGNDGGYYPTGIGWYRKTFTLPTALKGQKLWLYFEGIYMNSTIYVNGQQVGGHPYGYTSFFVDITEAVKAGKNVVAVRVDNFQQKNCRWYSGSGIYRHVWLVQTDELHVANWGVSVQTPLVNSDKAVVRLNTTVQNESDRERTFELSVNVDGQTSKHGLTIAANDSVAIEQSIDIAHPRLWDFDHPESYEATVTLTENGKTIDAYRQPFGIRSIEYSNQGLLLNGRSIKLNGGCLHHDNGLLGAVAFDAAEARKAQLMKDAGFNAVRTSHNPPSEAFLDACDRLGLLVIDEAFDGWRDKKNDHDYSTLFDQWWQNDVQSLVLRDRNHPSVMAWSIGNEVIERKKLEVVTTAHKLTQAVKAIDPTRPVTSALASWDNDWEIYDPLAAEHDIVGYNYMLHKAESDHKRVPSRVMWQTESYPRDAFQNWERVNDHAYIIGDFVWTAVDYLGESGIGRYWYDGDVDGEHWVRPLYPWHAAYCGDIDLTGWRKPISHYRSMLYNDTEKLYLAVREPDGYNGKIHTGLWAVWPTWESWNWPGHEGKDIEVEVYSHYPTVRLYLNDQLVGEKVVGRETGFKAVFTLPYQPGTLRAQGIDKDNAMETVTLATTGEPVAIRLLPESTTLKADGQDLCFVQVEIVDENGNICPNAAVDLTLQTTGAADIAAAGSADIKDTASSVDNTFKTWKGRGLIVLRNNERMGKATLTVKGDGLKSTKLTVLSKK